VELREEKEGNLAPTAVISKSRRPWQLQLL